MIFKGLPCIPHLGSTADLGIQVSTMSPAKALQERRASVSQRSCKREHAMQHQGSARLSPVSQGSAIRSLLTKSSRSLWGANSTVKQQTGKRLWQSSQQNTHLFLSSNLGISLTLCDQDTSGRLQGCQGSGFALLCASVHVRHISWSPMGF